MQVKKLRLFTIPNLLTLGNLVCGSLATVFAVKHGDLSVTFWLVAAAAVLDFLDGFAARLTGQYSEVGKQLDSLCDMVSFGVAPSAVLYTMFIASGGTEPLAWTVFIVAMFSALRLAKFNVDETQGDSFVGLPTPACALFIVSAGWLMSAGRLAVAPEAILVAAACLSFLLVCPLRMFALKFHGFSLSDNLLRYCFIAVSAAAVIIFHIGAIPVIVAGYILISAVCRLVCAKHRS